MTHFGFSDGSVRVENSSCLHIHTSPAEIKHKTTVLLVTRNGETKGRFDIAGTEKGRHTIMFCLDGHVFRQILIEHAPIGCPVEIFKPDGTSFIYKYRG